MEKPERRQCLERAGWNVLHLDPVDIELDLLSDVPARSFAPEVIAEGTLAANGPYRDPDFNALATRLYGQARYVVSTKGRAAELALIHAITSGGRALRTVVTHGLFRSTQHALSHFGTTQLEIAPRSSPSGTADLDVAWLKTRLAQGNVDALYLEPCNNGLAGWALSLANMREVSALCRDAGVLLLFDATRLLANVVALGEPLASAADWCGLADAFTVSCAKELLAPYGALVGVRDEALEKRVFAYCFDEGTLLEPMEARVCLAAGMRSIAADASPLVERRRLLHALAAALMERKVSVVDPHGCHAVFVRLPQALLDANDPLRGRAIEAHLFSCAGIRTLAMPNPALGATVLRLPLTVGQRYDVSHIADGIADLISSAASIRPLRELPTPKLHPMLGRFAPRE